MPKLKVNDDELDLLTDEERIGLKEYQAELDAEAAAEDAMIAAAAAGDPEEAEPEPEPEEEEPAEEEPEPEPEEEEPEPEPEDDNDEPDAGDDAGADDEPVEDEQDDDQPQTTPIAAYKLTQAEEARFGAIDTQLDEIAVKFDDGEITAKEMRDLQKPLVAELDELKEKRAVAKMSGKVTVDNWYGSTIPMFLSQHPEYKDGSMRHKLLDSVVRDLQTAQPDNPTDPKILFEAHKKIVAELGEVNGKAKAKEPPKLKKKAKQRDMPPSINNIPASDQTQVTAVNKFARLDKLKGVDYERALAKLAPADREFYLQGG